MDTLLTLGAAEAGMLEPTALPISMFWSRPTGRVFSAFFWPRSATVNQPKTWPRTASFAPTEPVTSS